VARDICEKKGELGRIFFQLQLATFEKKNPKSIGNCSNKKFLEIFARK